MTTKTQALYALMTGKKKEEIRGHIRDKYTDNKFYSHFAYLYIASNVKKHNVKNMLDAMPEVLRFIEEYNPYNPKEKDAISDFNDGDWWWIK